MPELFTIQERPVGEGAPCFVIAEMGLAHDGSLGAAHAFIDAVAEAGADAVKFQTHIAEAEGTEEERFRVNVFPQDASRRDYWRRTAFTEVQWVGLREHADERKVVFLSSPFSGEAVSLLERVGVPAWKIASGEMSNTPLLEEVLRTGLPVLLSTGMATLEEVDSAVKVFLDAGAPLLLYQCTNRYPCPPEHLGLNMLGVYKERYGVPVGLSDHSGRTAPAVAAVTLGASSVEAHVTFDRRSFGPDVAASLTVEEFGGMVQGVRFVEEALASPVDKDLEAGQLKEIRALFTKSIVAARDLSAGTVLTEGDLAFKKPGTGIPAGDYRTVLGRRTTKELKRDDQLTREGLNGPEA